MVERFDGRKNLTYSSYLFPVGYKRGITNWNWQALLDGYAFCHVTVLFLEEENLALKRGFPLAGTRKIAPQKITHGELPNPNPNTTPQPPPLPPRATLMGAIFLGQFVEGNFPDGEILLSCLWPSSHRKCLCSWERESSSHQNLKRGQVKGRCREGECGRRIARKIRVLARENFTICVHH